MALPALEKQNKGVWTNLWKYRPLFTSFEKTSSAEKEKGEENFKGILLLKQTVLQKKELILANFWAN